MNQQQKMELLRYLYKDAETQKFLCNDLFQEFMNTIPKTKCICSENIVHETRHINRQFVTQSIGEFIQNNKAYKEMLNTLYQDYEESDLIEHLLMGYVFFIAQTEATAKEIDIFKDKKSICYTEGPSIADFIL